MTANTPLVASAAAATATDLSQEASAGVLEWVLIAALVALAAAYLWRTWFGRRGKGCAGCGSAKSCAIAKQADGCAAGGPEPDEQRRVTLPPSPGRSR